MNVLTAELIGTALLVLLGNGVVASCCLKDTKSGPAGWMVIATAWAFAVYVGVVVAGPISGAHLNPAVTLGLAIKGATPWSMVPTYIGAQFIGAIIGAFLVWLFFIDHFAVTLDEDAKRACFCTYPAIRNYPVNFISELVGTFVLVFVLFYIIGNGASLTLPGEAAATPVGLGSIGGLPVAILIWAIGLSLGATTGYAINPARDLGPALRPLHAAAAHRRRLVLQLGAGTWPARRGRPCRLALQRADVTALVSIKNRPPGRFFIASAVAAKKAASRSFSAGILMKLALH